MDHHSVIPPNTNNNTSSQTFLTHARSGPPLTHPHTHAGRKCQWAPLLPGTSQYKAPVNPTWQIHSNLSQFQHLCWTVPASGDIHICCSNLDHLAHGATYNLQKSRETIVHRVGIEIATLRLRQHRQLPVVQHVRSTLQKMSPKDSSNNGAKAALDILQPAKHDKVLFQRLCYFELCSGSGSTFAMQLKRDVTVQAIITNIIDEAFQE